MASPGRVQKLVVLRDIPNDDDPRTYVSGALDEVLRMVGMVVQHGERSDAPYPTIDGWFSQGLFVGTEIAEFGVAISMAVHESVDGTRGVSITASVDEPRVVV